MDRIPEPIRPRIAWLQQGLSQLIDGAIAHLQTELPGPIAFRFQGRGRDILKPDVLAQSISFVTRFEHLPDQCEVKAIEDKGKHHIGNMRELRCALHEYRPVIQNERDSVHYQKIHRVWYGMFTLDDVREGTIVRALDTRERDVTPTYIRWLSEHNQAISFVLRALDYDYLYNGILQHSDRRYSEQFLKDYTTGEINYILWKHVHVLSFIRDMLEPYYVLIRFLICPTPGPL